jgi:hypothetical protein
MGNDSYLVAAAKRFTDVVESRRRAYYRFKMEKELTDSVRKRKKEEALRLKAARDEVGHSLCANSISAARRRAFPPHALFKGGEGEDKDEEDEQEDEEEEEEVNSDSDIDEVV